MKRISHNSLALVIFFFLSISALELQAQRLACAFGTDGVQRVIIPTAFTTAPFTSASVTDIEVYQTGTHMGKMVVSFNVSKPAGTGTDDSDVGIARYNANGTLDGTFGTGGTVGPLDVDEANRSFKVLIQNDGKVLLLSNSTKPGTVGGNSVGITIHRFTANGSVDISYSGDGKVVDYFLQSAASGGATNLSEFYDAVLDGSGRVVACGYIGGRPGNFSDRQSGIVRFSTSGSRDGLRKVNFRRSGSSSGPSERFASLDVLPDNRIVAVGEAATGLQEGVKMTAVRLLSDFTFDPSFGTNGREEFTGQGNDPYRVVQAKFFDGDKIAIGYQGTGENNFLVMCRNANGGLNTAFGAGGTAELNAGASITSHALRDMEVQKAAGNDKILVIGRTSGGGDFVAMRADKTGAIDGTFGIYGVTTVNTAGSVRKAALQPNGKLICVNSSSGKVTFVRMETVVGTAPCDGVLPPPDNTDPVITCPSNIVEIAASGTCSAVASYTVRATDNTNIVTKIQTDNSGFTSGSTFPKGVTTQTWKATDGVGRNVSCSFTITVYDTEKPTISCPGNYTENNTSGVCGKAITYSVTSADNCTGEIQSQTDGSGLTSGSIFSIGTTIQTWRVTDASLNTSTCSFSVTINDNQLPTITCPGNVTLNNDLNMCGAIHIYSVGTGDNCPNEQLAQDNGQASNTLFPLGVTDNEFTVTDASSNSATCSFSVTVNDNVKPVISLVGDNPVILCEGDTYSESGATATDNCDPNIQQGLTMDNSSVNTSTEGVYTVTYNVTDNYSNSAEQVTRTVRVKHRPGKLAQQGCGSCGQIRYDFCEGEAISPLETILMTNANHEPGITFFWYADNSNSQGASISRPSFTSNKNKTRFYWVGQELNGCEGPAIRVRLRVRKTSTVVFDLPGLGCNPGQIDLARWVSDSRNIASGFDFFDSDPDLGATAIGSVTATNGQVNTGQMYIVTVPANPITYYASAGNNTGCQTSASDLVVSSATALLDPISNVTATAGDMVSVPFISANATNIIWYNTNPANPNIGIMGTVGMGNLMFTAQNTTAGQLVSTIRVVPYLGNCAGTYQDFTITVNPGGNTRQGQNRLQLAAFRIGAEAVQVNWDIQYEFPLSHVEVEKMNQLGEWEKIGESGWYAEQAEYTYLDKEAFETNLTYRLKMVHLDGRIMWSKAVEVNRQDFGDNGFVMYPNPTTGRFHLQVPQVYAATWSYQLIDNMGRVLLAGKLTEKEMIFDLSAEASGIYHVLIVDLQGNRHMQKVMKH